MACPAIGGAQGSGYYRFKVGAFEAIALYDGIMIRDRPPGFVRNVGDDDVGEAYALVGLPRDKLTITLTALAINTGQNFVLIDTGMGEGGPPGTGAVSTNLAAAGIQPENVDTVIISHFHADHILGLRRKDGSLAFPNAQVLVPGVEWDYWMDDGRFDAAPEALKGNFGAVRRVFGSGANDVRRYIWGEELLPGLTAVDARGHTPGMSAIKIMSDDAVMMFVADITNNPLIFARNPSWQAMFDMDPQQAVDTRRKLLDRAAADKLQLFFFHAPFPALGYIIKSGNGYEYAPALWTYL